MRIRIALASEFEVEEYRRQVRAFLSAIPEIVIVDIAPSDESDEIDSLAASCVSVLNRGDVDSVALLSRSGSAFAMTTNKFEDIRSVVLPDARYIEEAISLDANMAELSTHQLSPGMAGALIAAFSHARESSHG